jgi:hypothetical protein
MPVQVVEGAMMMCTMGLGPPAPLNASVPPTFVTATGLPAANVGHFAPMVNIPTFGMCNSPSNPQVIAATAAALGVHTPMPCIPVTTGPWEPGAIGVKIGELPALTNDSMCMCAWAGEISITEPGQVSVEST